MINLTEDEKIHIKALIDQKLISMSLLEKRNEKHYIKFLKRLKTKLIGGVK